MKWVLLSVLALALAAIGTITWQVRQFFAGVHDLAKDVHVLAKDAGHLYDYLLGDAVAKAEKIQREHERLTGALAGLSITDLIARLAPPAPAGKKALGASPATLAAAEKRLGRRLPAGYREFLGIRDGLDGGEAFPPLFPVARIAPVAKAAPRIAALLAKAAREEKGIAAKTGEQGVYGDQISARALEDTLVVGAATRITGPGGTVPNYLLLTTAPGVGLDPGQIFAVSVAQDVNTGEDDLMVDPYKDVRGFLVEYLVAQPLQEFIHQLAIKKPGAAPPP